MTLYVLPDTNALLHFRRPDQLDWKVVAGRSDVTIVVSSTLLRELDKHAHGHAVPRLRERARTIVQWIRGLMSGAASAVPVIIRAEEPKDYFATGLDPTIPDDRFIASALMLIAEGKDVAVMSDDTVMQAKLPAHRVRGIWPKDEDILKFEPDPIEAENQKLKKDLAAVTARRPDLSLEWKGGSKILDVSISPISMHGLKSVEEMLATHPFLDEPPPQPAPYPAAKVILAPQVSIHDLANLRFAGPTPHQIVSYNLELGQFHALYGAYVQEMIAWRERRARIIELSLVVRNKGTALASSFQATVRLPDGLTLLKPEDRYGNPPTEPSAPPKPGAVRLPRDFGFGARVPDAHISRLRDLHRDYDDGPYLSVRENRFRLKQPRVQHHKAFNFDPAYVLVDESLIGKGAELTVEIIAEELPHPIMSKLVIRFQ